MKGKAWAAARKAWTAMRWVIVALFGLAYVFVWGVWGIGGVELLGGLGSSIPFLITAFLVASLAVLVVGGIGLGRDLLGLLGLQLRKD